MFSLFTQEWILKERLFDSILQRLESATDRPELEAAIWAADRICAVSLRFAPFILPRIEAKLDGK